MKKTILLLFVLFNQFLTAQVVSIAPNQGNLNQTLTTTITLANGILTNSSAPQGLNDIYMYNGTDIIYADAFTIYPSWPTFADSLSATFTIPNFVATGWYDVHVTTYQNWGFPPPTPVDNFLTNGFYIGNPAGYIEGDVYYDANQNGTRDTAEIGLSSQRVLDNPTGLTIFTDQNGHYRFAADTGVHNVSVVLPTLFSQTSLPLNYNLSVPPDSLGNDFGLYTPPSTFYTQNFYLYTHAMRCIARGYSSWCVKNTSPLIQTGSVTVIHSSNLSVYATTPSPSTVSGDTLRWDYNLPAFGTINASVTYMNPAAGDTVWYTVIDSVFDQFGIFQKIYTDSFTFVVSCSVDPNDKSASPPGVDAAHYTLLNSVLDYTIRFQNTGTDTAYNVLITDTLDINLDLNTLEILGSSHPLSVQVDSNRKISFIFDNILLPDSNIDEEHSHGFVAYRVHPISSITDGTPVNNTAYIYFDFNSAVVTNTTTNTMVLQIPVGLNEIKNSSMSYVYPNPVTSSSVLVNPSTSPVDLSIYDNTGREILRKEVNGNYNLIKSKFSSGIYYYQLRSKDGSISNIGKFIIAD